MDRTYISQADDGVPTLRVYSQSNGVVLILDNGNWEKSEAYPKVLLNDLQVRNLNNLLTRWLDSRGLPESPWYDNMDPFASSFSQ